MPNVMDLTSVYNNVPAYSTPNSWSYAMRRTMQEIIPGLFLGPYSAALKNCHSLLLTHKVTHIICVRQDIEAHFIRPQFSDFTYLTLDIADVATENIIKFFPKVRQFIDDAFAKGAKVLVHGNNGNSRSATLVLAYIMEKLGLNCKEAYSLAKERRASIKPNEGFVAQLVEYEPIYKAQQILRHGESSSDKHRVKRKSEFLSEMIDVDLVQPPSSPVTDPSGEDIYMQDIVINK